MLKTIKQKLGKLYRVAFTRMPIVISYEQLCTFKDEPAISLTRAEYDAIQIAIRRYVIEGGDLRSGKISRKTHGLKYSVNIVDSNFILSYHIDRINELESYIYRKKGDKTPLQVEKNKKPMLYDAGINLTTGKPMFVKEYRDTDINAAASTKERHRQIKKLEDERNNLQALKAPCLFWRRQDKYYLATPYVDKHDYFEWMDKKCGTHEESIAIFRLIVQKILALHKNGWMHCDIKAENFIPKRTKDGMDVSLIDHATFHKISDAKNIKTVIGSDYYINANWKKDFEAGKASYSAQNDIYALNVLLGDVAGAISTSTTNNAVKDVLASIRMIKKLPINQCFKAEKLLAMADDLSASLKPQASHKANMLRACSL